MARFVLWGAYCSDALQKRTPYREEHLARLRTLKLEGILITLGPTEDCTHVFGIFDVDNLSSARNVIMEDIYWKNGIWKNFEVYPWIQVF